MRRNLGSILRSSLLLATVMLALGGCGQSFDDPATAQCAAPPVAFDQPVDKGTHREVVVHFTCEGVRASTDVDPQQIGFVGTSQAGWIIPHATVASHKVAFLALASAAVLPYEQVKAYAELTGGTGSDKPFPSKEEIAKTLQDAGPSGADPRSDLEQLTIPALWLYGTADREVPVDQSVALLNTLKAQGKNFTIITYPDAGHGLLDSPPTDPQAPATFVEWVLKQVHTEDA